MIEISGFLGVRFMGITDPWFLLVIGGQAPNGFTLCQCGKRVRRSSAQLSRWVLEKRSASAEPAVGCESHVMAKKVAEVDIDFEFRQVRFEKFFDGAVRPIEVPSVSVVGQVADDSVLDHNVVSGMHLGGEKLEYRGAAFISMRAV